MKLVWMVLFALPIISLTSCEDDKDELFKDYSNLLGKTETEVLNIMDRPATQVTAAIYFENINDVPNVEEVDVYWTLDDYDDNGNLIVFNKAVQVDTYLVGLTSAEITNHLTDLYGKSKVLTYEDEEDGDVWTETRWEKGNKYIFFDAEDLTVTYVDKKEWDKSVANYGGDDDNAAMSLRARKLRRAHR